MLAAYGHLGRGLHLPSDRHRGVHAPVGAGAARLRAAAHGGQILISDDVQRGVALDLPDGAWLLDLGVHRMKDLTRPERIWQLGHADLPSDFPAINTLDARGHNLPLQLTAFV